MLTRAGVPCLRYLPEPRETHQHDQSGPRNSLGCHVGGLKSFNPCCVGLVLKAGEVVCQKLLLRWKISRWLVAG